MLAREKCTSPEILLFLSYLTNERRLSDHTIDGYGRDLCQFNRLLPAGLMKATSSELRSAFTELQASGMKPRSLARKHSSLRHFYRHMRRRRLVFAIPLNNIPLPRCGKCLPKPIGDEDFAKLLGACDQRTALGIRDLAILRVLDSCGLRASELIRLELTDLHLNDEYLVVREGKGDKDRFTPIDKPAVSALCEYLARSRPVLYSRKSPSRVFPFTRQGLVYILHELSGRAGVQRYHPHQLRHRLGTMLIRQGLELREVADILGHSSTDTTEGYVALDLNDLRKVFRNTHPRAVAS